MERWYLTSNNEVFGPYAVAELFQQPEITPETLVCREGEGEWQTVEAAGLFTQSEPDPQDILDSALPPEPKPVRERQTTMVMEMLALPRPLLFVLLLVGCWGFGYAVMFAFQSGIPENIRDGMDCMEEEDLAGAATAFKAEIAENPESFLGHLMLGEVYFRQHDYQQAREMFERAEDINPADRRASQGIDKVVAVEALMVR